MIRNPRMRSVMLIAVAWLLQTGCKLGVEQNVGTDAASGTVVDYDGNVYRWVKIGDQAWMAQNLAATHYSSGEPIPDGTRVDFRSIDQSSKYRFVYEGNVANVKTYGLLYTWAAALNGAEFDSSGTRMIQGACPAGWHIPHDTEWHTLETRLGVREVELRSLGSRGTDAGGKLKTSGSDHWQSLNLGATNQVGFDALPAGYYLDGKFARLGSGTYFWGPERSETEFAINHNLRYNESQIGRGQGYKKSGFSVRCVRD
jgi:uncharacterized protein (TIGR02145 family)